MRRASLRPETSRLLVTDPKQRAIAAMGFANIPNFPPNRGAATTLAPVILEKPNTRFILCRKCKGTHVSKVHDSNIPGNCTPIRLMCFYPYEPLNILLSGAQNRPPFALAIVLLEGRYSTLYPGPRVRLVTVPTNVCLLEIAVAVEHG